MHAQTLHARTFDNNQLSLKYLNDITILVLHFFELFQSKNKYV